MHPALIVFAGSALVGWAWYAIASDELRVTRICVEKGPTQRRFSARAKGRGTRIEKRTCHIFVTVGDTKPARKSKK